MEIFCNSSFWVLPAICVVAHGVSLYIILQDPQLTWNTADPYFTSCFEDTVLTWLPQCFIFISSWFDVRLSLNSKRSGKYFPLNWTLLSITKFIVAVSLVCVALIKLIGGTFYYNYDKINLVGSGVRLGGLMLVFLLMVLSKHKGARSSVIQFFYWCITLLCEGILFRTAVYKYNEVTEESKFIYIHRFIVLPLVIVQFTLHCFSDGDNAEFGFTSPEVNASCLSKICYSWFDSMAWRGYRNPLKVVDLWVLKEKDRASRLVPRFQQCWRITLDAAKRQHRTKRSFKPPGIGLVLFKCYWKPFVVAGIMKLIQDLLPLVSPVILKLLIAHVTEHPDVEASWKGYMYSIVLVSCSLLATIFGVQHNEKMLRIGMWTRTVLTSAIYKKSLCIRNASKRSTTGEVINLMSVDIQRLMELAPFVHMVWTAPIQIGLSLYFLYNTLGIAILAGLAVIILCVPLNGFLTAKQRVLQMQQLKLKDKRIKLMGEIMTGMKTVKLYGWEPALQKQVDDIRSREIGLLKKIAYYGSATTFSFNCLPLVVALATFSVYVFTGDDHNLDAERAFVSLALFNIMRMPMVMFPMTLALILQSMVSENRLNKYLNGEELDPNGVTHNESEHEAIEMRDSNFSWTLESMTLMDINMTCKHGSLTAIVGDVGSGKTSLLSALLGNIPKVSGAVNVVGSVGYVSQEAWIQNATLRDNIVFNEPFDEGKYKRTTSACGLGPDIKSLDAGDDTEIGERGMNLSGGQKQRVSLARAAYKESDVYLFDDSLSALDAGVGKHIFDNVIGPNGCLKHATRIFVTHGLPFLPYADQIVVLEAGRIIERGTYTELREKGVFQDLIFNSIPMDEEGGAERLFPKLEKANAEHDITARSNLMPGSEEQELEANANEKKTLVADEISATGNIKVSVLASYFKSCGIILVISVIVFSLLQIGLATYTNIWLARWAAEATKDGDSHDGLQQIDTTIKYIGGYGALGLAQCIAIVVGAIAVGLATLNSAAALHSVILQRVLRAPMSFFDTTLSGRLINYFSKDVDVLDNFIPLNIKATINSLCSTFSLIINIVYSTPIFATFLLPVTVVYFFLQRFYIATSRQLKRMEAISRSPIYSCFSETIAGAATIRAFRQQEIFIANLEKQVDQNQQAYSPFLASTLWINVRLEIIGALVTFAAAIFALDARGEIDPAIVGLSISSSLAITQQLKFLVKLMSELETNVVSAERVMELSHAPQEAALQLDKRPSKEWPERGEITFQHYQTRYREGLDLVLKGITCRIHPGEKIGIVGRTGAGKSSLTLALFRLVEPVSGTICIDGEDITQFGLHDLRSSISIIPQKDPVLFSGTLRMNLDPLNKFPDNAIWECLESAHLKRYVESLPQGLDFEVNGDGSSFSAGQRQLVCLARALLRRTNVIVLDEATAAVDLKTDNLIQNTIRTQFANTTVITIAHRLNNIMDSTRILVLDDGRIVEFDTPKTLMTDPCSMFHAMVKHA